MVMFKEFYRKNKAYFWIGLFIFCLFSYTWQLPHHIRYCIESTFGNPKHYIDDLSVGVIDTAIPEESRYGGWDAESEDFYDDNHMKVNISQFEKSEVYVMGTYINSFDDVLLACNGEPIKVESGNYAYRYRFWDNIYVIKTFTANLTNKKYGLNEIVVREGNAKEIYYVYLEWNYERSLIVGGDKFC